MKTIKFSVVIFYNSVGELLIQDRRNLGKDNKEWWWFWGGSENNESPIETAIREIEEEICIQLMPDVLFYLGKTLVEKILDNTIFEWNVFITPWEEKYENSFKVLEWAGSQWVSPEKMRKLFIYDTQRIHITMAEDYLKSISTK
jgi:8-oxo-dGTP pyrophosphatase MutT (NUDIX family)